MSISRRDFTRQALAIAAAVSVTPSMRTLAAALPSGQDVPRSRNPILQGWYADPEARILDGAYWIYPTYSAPYDEQVFLDAFSSKDLITWTKHPRVLDVAKCEMGEARRVGAVDRAEGRLVLPPLRRE